MVRLDGLGADLYANARIRTQWHAVPEADAMVVAGGRVCWIGSECDLGTGLSLRRHNLEDATVWPALGDAHTHFVDHSLMGLRLDWPSGTRRDGGATGGGATELAIVVERVRRWAAANPGRAWVRGHGWNENRWREARLPTRHDLDAACERPVVLTRADYHMAWANSAALAAAGIGPDTPDPGSGHIDRDESGRPTGILRESAMGLVLDHVPPPTLQERLQAVRDGQAEAHRLGIASVHTMEGAAALEALQAVHCAGELKLRVTVLLPVAMLDQLSAVGLRCGFGDEWLRLGQLKLFADGSLGSRTAWMIAPYADDATNRGTRVLDEEGLRQTIGQAHAAGWPCAVHAIGDAANAAVAAAFGSVPRVAGAYPDRVEHVQLARPEDMRRLAARGLVASMQPVHVSTDWRIADRVWGDRARHGYAWRSVAAAGCTLAFGSDAPVEPLDPWAGLQVAVTRRGLDGLPTGGWYPDERLTLAEALRGFTVGVAAAGGRPVGGMLAPGQPADFVVLGEDPFALSADGLGRVRPRATYVGGELAHSGGAEE